MKSPLDIGRAHNGLYFLCSKCHIPCPNSTVQNVGSHNKISFVHSSLHSVSSNPSLFSNFAIPNSFSCNSLSNVAILSFNERTSTAMNNGPDVPSALYPKDQYTQYLDA